MALHDQEDSLLRSSNIASESRARIASSKRGA
jgi:hypothetical protein